MCKRICGVSIVILIMLLIYCCYPYSLRDIIDIDSTQSLYGNVIVMDIDDGTTTQHTYEIQACDSTSNEFKEIIKILQSTSYQQDLDNLFPVSTDKVSTTGINQFITVTFCSNSETRTLYLLDNNNVYIAQENSYKRFHMTSNQTLKNLIEYINSYF